VKAKQDSSPQHVDTTNSSGDTPCLPSYVLMPGPKQDAYLDTSLPSRITRVTFEVLGGSQAVPGILNVPDDGPNISDVSQVDRSLLTPSAVRFLLNRYNRCIRPRYDILVAELLSHDGTGLKKLHGNQKFHILMACAIAAACEGYRNPHWILFSQVCRNWANELVTPIISARDEDSLTAILLLLIYELADPSRGITWELLDLAIRTCIQLGWHRTTDTSIHSLAPLDSSSAKEDSVCGTGEARLMSVLRHIEGYV
jgi:hypothetical protein